MATEPRPLNSATVTGGSATQAFQDAGGTDEDVAAQLRDPEIAATQELLLKLLHSQREAVHPTVMMQAAAEAIGLHLKADRAGFFEMVGDETTRLVGCWTAGELPLLSGDVPISVIGVAQLEQARLGRICAISDYRNDPLTHDSSFQEIGVRSGIGVPFIRNSRLKAGFYVHHSKVRVWAESEVAFARKVAGQAMEAVELVEAQQAVRQSEARLRKILESIGDAVIVTDANLTITGMNPVAERLTGWPQKEAQGRPLDAVFRMVEEQTGHDLRIEFASSEERKQSVVDALLVDRRGKRLPIEQSGSMMREDDGSLSGLVLIFRDTTNREVTERRLRQAYKMEALGQLTGGIAHDFNNILAIIMGNLELIAEDTPTGSAASGRIEQAIASAQRAADLTRRLLAYARQQPLNPVIVDVAQLVHSSAEFIRRSLGPAVVLQVEVAAGLWAARIDRSQFENALLNLAVNSRDAMPNGGQLKIACRNWLVGRPGTETTDEIKPGEYLQISITDTGRGMSTEELLRATEPFFTTKPVGQGTGLGLSMVYGFLKQSGGHLRIESELEIGTRVELYLPRSVAVERRAEALRGRPLPQPLPRGDELVLVVEDELAIRRTIGYLLTSLGYRILEAEDGPAALLHLEGSSGINLLFTDVILPNGMSGPTLADKAVALQPEIKVIFSSGYTHHVLTRDYGMQEGAHLLNKPFPLAELANKIRSVLDDSRPQS